MDVREQAPPAGVAGVAEEAMAAVQRWRSEARTQEDPAESRLAALLATDGGQDFAIRFLEGVLQPDDLAVAAKNLQRLSLAIPAGVRWETVVGTHLAGGFGTLAPAVIVPLAREAFLRSIGHLVLRQGAGELSNQLAALERPGGIRPVIEPLLGVASGRREGEYNAAILSELLRQPNLHSLSVWLPSVIGRPGLLDFDGVAVAATERVAPLFEFAAHSDVQKRLVLDITRYDELELGMRVFERMAGEFPQLDIGISLPASVPQSLPALERVIELARGRRRRGDAPLTVRLAPAELTEEDRAVTETNGWPSTDSVDISSSESHFLRLVDVALSSAKASGLRVVSATPNLFATAFVWRLARARGVEGFVEHEFRLGVRQHEAEAVKRDVGGLRLLVPLVVSGGMPRAVPLLVGRVSEFSVEKVADGRNGPTATKQYLRERDRFLAVLAESQTPSPVATQSGDDRRWRASHDAVLAYREWANGVLERSRESASGEALLARSIVHDQVELDAAISGAVQAGTLWGQRRGSTRATVIDSVAEVIDEWRGRLVEVAVSESGLTVEEADHEVTLSLDIAAVAAVNARELGHIVDAAFVPPRLTVVASSRTSPIADAAGSVLAALAAGSAVILKTAPETRRSSAVLVETLVAAGVPEGLVSIIDDEGDIARSLISDPRVDRVVHSGSRHTAKLFTSWSAEARISSITGGRNSIIVTPSADLERAVPQIVASAFDHGGQAATATSVVILVGSVGSSERFLGRLTDAVASIPVSLPGTPGAGLSALARPAGKRELRSLEELGQGESWRVKPRRMDREGRLWSSGLRDGVGPDSAFRKHESRAPVLGIVRVDTLDEAIALQNASGFGLAAGIQALDPDEIELWLESVEAGLLCVNGPVRVEGPVEGWNRSALGIARAAGGQDAAVAAGLWRPVALPQESTVTLEGVSGPASRLIQTVQSDLDFNEFDWIRSSARSDDDAWQKHYSVTELTRGNGKRVVRRYLPVPVTLRLSEDAPVAEAVRLLVAAARTGARVAVSTTAPLPESLIALFGERDSPVDVIEVIIESEARWRARVLSGGISTSRIRLVGGDPDILNRLVHEQHSIATLSGPVTASGRVELLSFLRAQTVCVGVRLPELNE